MSRTDWIYVFLIILGIILFLVGANVYNDFVGWLGFFLALGSIIAYIIFYIYNYLARRRESPTTPAPAQNP